MITMDIKRDANDAVSPGTSWDGMPSYAQGVGYSEGEFFALKPGPSNPVANNIFGPAQGQTTEIG